MRRSTPARASTDHDQEDREIEIELRRDGEELDIEIEDGGRLDVEICADDD
jgi:sensor histidine kinase regulating citrate/malate metabolism